MKPRIIADKYLQDDKKGKVFDYKFYCFNGEPKFLYIMYHVGEHLGYCNFYDIEFNKLKLRMHRPYIEETVEKPDTYEQMVEFSRKLSQGIRFIRIDFYEINGKLYFGEFTLTPSDGMGKFHPECWDEKIGEYLKL